MKKKKPSLKSDQLNISIATQFFSEAERPVLSVTILADAMFRRLDPAHDDSQSSRYFANIDRLYKHITAKEVKYWKRVPITKQELESIL